MANPFSVGPNDVQVDDSGRVIISNPQLAAQIQTAVAAMVEPTNGNCHGCNAVAHCGAKLQ
jgi:hypothetical protein